MDPNMPGPGDAGGERYSARGGGEGVAREASGSSGEGWARRRGRAGCARWVRRATSTAFASPMAARCCQKNCDLRQVNASTPGSSIIPKAGEGLRGETVGEDIQEAQELPADPARGGHCTWEEGVGSAIPVGVPVPVVIHLFACLVLQEPVIIA